MLYYIAMALKPHLGALNALTYLTTRAGGAAITGFVFALLIGPRMIEWLRALKVGQYIRQEHVEDLHALHKGKAGTPTMGGALIILSALLSLVLWARLDNRLLLAVVFVFCLLGAVGFLDDYIKLRRKHNQGLSAKAKFIGQIAAGVLLGVFLYMNPITEARQRTAIDHVRDWPALMKALNPNPETDGKFGAVVLARLSPAVQRDLRQALPGVEPDKESKERIIRALDGIFATIPLPEELSPDAVPSQGEGPAKAGTEDMVEANQERFESAYPGVLAWSVARWGTRNLHTSVEIPGLRSVVIPLGVLYILFVVMIIVGSSNAVNLTDGLDGLAIGASIMSLLAYTGIAYVVSRSDWSEYLFLIYVPEASELTVFGAALLGTSLGFLWFNSHPAEVFMGDTGSLALGGAIGTMAILTKQELLLIVVGGLFVLEALSVIIQVASFKLRGKRVFKMAPLHHHFELSGWSESKVIVRFWILSLLFALMSLGALKLR
jgi:phospho-N-acetylmuramoyl-pentapeptide-transferase